MAFKSHAQRLHFEEKLKKGDIDRDTFDSYAKGSPSKMPMRVGDAVTISARAIPKPRSIEEMKKAFRKAK